MPQRAEMPEGSVGVELASREGRRPPLLSVAMLIVAAVFLVAIPQANAVEVVSQAPTELEAVSATSATDAWSVGYRDDGAEALTLHWDGRSWSPVPNSVSAKLLGVSALSPTDAWAVGGYSAPRSHTVQTLILHWDGSTWTRVPSPNSTASINQLEGVSAVSANDAWAVGDFGRPGRPAFHALILHWNGARWSTVPAAGGELHAVSGVSSRSAWAVGFGTLLHWNGARWSRQSIRTRDFLETVPVSRLLGVSALSSRNVWAVGNRCAHFGSCVARTEIIHWNGARWSPVSSPAPSRFANHLTGVSALSAGDAWAVGAYCTTRTCSRQRTLVARWNGRRWSTVPSPNPSSSRDLLAGVEAISPRQAWAVGDRAGGSSGSGTLLLGWNGTGWLPT
jgi:hypothetical protein